ncbi:hypothetical protein F0562_017618 [Nyssa sinensis]|uniref:Uncharacterized protein n=1 Tax=Nyssa sinensis TaxID=561372 RepID=A0A5J4ZFB0_9ASTE|nr:hypothetical protein F0562_017618 [Nyssa sinensis]
MPEMPLVWEAIAGDTVARVRYSGMLPKSVGVGNCCRKDDVAGCLAARCRRTRIVESRNAILGNDWISGSDQTRNIVSEKDHSKSQPSTSSDRLVIVYNTPQVQTGVEQPIVEVSQAADDIPADHVVQELPRTFKQRFEPHTSQEYDATTLKRSIRPKRSTILDDYVVCL